MLDIIHTLRQTMLMASFSFKRIFLNLIKWGISAAMLAYVLHEVDGQQLLRMISIQSPLIPVAATVLILIQMIISTLRWQYLVLLLSNREVRPPFGLLTRLNFVSIFFNNCLPGTIGGDMIRAMMLRSDKLPLSVCAHSVIIDRLMAVVGIFIILLVGLPWLGDYLPFLPVPWLMAGCIAAFIAGLVILSRISLLLAKWPSRPILRMLHHLFDQLRHIIFSLPDFTLLSIQAVMAHVFFCLALFVLAYGIGTSLTISESLLLIPPVLLIIMLPISIGGWGIREVSMVTLLSLAGISKEAALTISIEFGILTVLISLPGAWFYARHKKL